MYKISLIMFVGMSVFLTVNGVAYSLDSDNAYLRANSEAKKGFDELDKEIEKLDNASKPNQDNQTPALKSSIESRYSVMEKPRPKAVVNKSHPLLCEDNFSDDTGFPDWVINPREAGYSYVAVGVGIYGEGGLAGQRRAAKIQAQGEISKFLSVQVDNQLNIAKKSVTSKNEDFTDLSVSSSSRQRSASMLENTKELQCWIDPETNDYYLLMGLPAATIY